MSNSILFQKQVRDNSTDLHTYVKELSNWEEEMKRKEVSREYVKDEELPPVRSKNIRKSTTDSPKPNRIRSIDYSSWDKFDVDAACQELDENYVKPLTKEELEREKERAYVEKENGNKFVKDQKWAEAIKCYTKAIKAYDSDPVFYANRALCYIKLKEYVNAEIDGTNSLRLDSTYVKALQRRAAARIQLAQLNEAYEDLKKVMELEPNNRESLIEITKLKRKLSIVDLPKFKEKQTASNSDEVKSAPNHLEKIESILKADKVESISKCDQLKSVSKLEQKLKLPIMDPIIMQQEGDVSNEVQKEKLIWSDLNDRVLIRPIVIPPHLRSKKPLKRIEIKEVDDILLNEKLKSNTEENCLENNEKIVEKFTTAEEKIVQEDNITINNEIDVDTITLPKTCLQFSTIWKTLGSNVNLKFKYFTKIHYNDLSQLFQEFLESDLFFDIINVLNENFSNENVDLIYNYLKSFTNVKRFSTIILFASQNEKICVKNILDKISQIEKIDHSSINKLQEIYVV